MANLEAMRHAIALSEASVQTNGGGPFGAVIVQNDVIVATGCNQVTSTNDPTAHAEIVAIRAACARLGCFHLHGCDIYTSCEPCPMCLGAIYWARLARIYYANTRQEAARIGFDDEFLYREMPLALEARAVPIIRLLADEARPAFDAWQQKADKVRY